MLVLALTRELDDAASGRDVAAKDGDTAGRLEGLLERLAPLLAGGLGRGRDLFADGPPGHGLLVGVDQPGLYQALADHGHATRLLHLGGRIRAPWLEIGDDRRLLRQAIEVVDGHLE